MEPAPKADSSITSAAVSDESEIEKHISAFLLAPSAITINPLIGVFIIYKDNTLQFIGIIRF